MLTVRKLLGLLNPRLGCRQDSSHFLQSVTNTFQDSPLLRSHGGPASWGSPPWRIVWERQAEEAGKAGAECLLLPSPWEPARSSHSGSRLQTWAFPPIGKEGHINLLPFWSPVPLSAISH